MWTSGAKRTREQNCGRGLRDATTSDANRRCWTEKKPFKMPCSWVDSAWRAREMHLGRWLRA